MLLKIRFEFLAELLDRLGVGLLLLQDLAELLLVLFGERRDSVDLLHAQVEQVCGTTRIPVALAIGGINGAFVIIVAAAADSLLPADGRQQGEQPGLGGLVDLVAELAQDLIGETSGPDPELVLGKLAPKVFGHPPGALEALARDPKPASPAEDGRLRAPEVVAIEVAGWERTEGVEFDEGGHGVPQTVGGRSVEGSTADSRVIGA